jgi:hypothetical protein
MPMKKSGFLRTQKLNSIFLKKSTMQFLLITKSKIFAGLKTWQTQNQLFINS